MKNHLKLMQALIAIQIMLQACGTSNEVEEPDQSSIAQSESQEVQESSSSQQTEESEQTINEVATNSQIKMDFWANQLIADIAESTYSETADLRNHSERNGFESIETAQELTGISTESDVWNCIKSVTVQTIPDEYDRFSDYSLVAIGVSGQDNVEKVRAKVEEGIDFSKYEDQQGLAAAVCDVEEYVQDMKSTKDYVGEDIIKDNGTDKFEYDILDNIDGYVLRLVGRDNVTNSETFAYAANAMMENTCNDEERQSFKIFDPDGNIYSDENSVLAFINGHLVLFTANASGSGEAEVYEVEPGVYVGKDPSLVDEEEKSETGYVSGEINTDGANPNFGKIEPDLPSEEEMQEAWDLVEQNNTNLH